MADITLLTSEGGIKRWRGREDGRAMVESVAYTSEETAAEEGRGYIAHAVCHTAAATSGTLLAIKNLSSDQSFHLTRIYVDPQTLTVSDLLLTQIINPTSVSGGTDVTTSAIIQKNTGKNNLFASSGAQILISDASADATTVGGDQFHEFPVDSRTPIPRDMVGTNVIAPGGTWVIGYKREGGGNAVDGEKISLSVNGYSLATSRE